MATDNDEDTGTEEEEKPKKKLNIAAILGITQMVLTAAFGGVLVWSLQGLEKPTLTHDKLQERAIASVHDEVGEIQNVDLEPFITNTLSKNTLKAAFSVEISDSATAEVLKSRLPAVRARILTLLSQQEGGKLKRMHDKLLLKDALREVMNTELEKSGVTDGAVRDVYFLEFIIM